MVYQVFGILPLLVIFVYNAEIVSSLGLNIVQLVQTHGYHLETHSSVNTSDGYLLDLHRIPHGKSNEGQLNKSVVLLMHGILGSSADWVVMGPKVSLAYILADAGYDVWMGNARGNTWSRKHETLDPDKDAEFWNFSWHEIGVWDLPAMIDHILTVTGQEDLFYYGYAQGTTSFFVMASERPEYNAKIRLMIALAPIAYMNHMYSPFFQILSVFNRSIAWVLKYLGTNEFLPHKELLTFIGQQVCRDESPFRAVCSNILFLIFGWDSQQLNHNMLPMILANIPAGAATKQLIHYSQEIKSGKFRQFDYYLENIRIYGAHSPPEYNLENIVAPVALCYGSDDWLVAASDVKRLAIKLPNLVLDYFVQFPKLTHLDFLYAMDLKELVFNSTMELMISY